ncbi:MAG: tripartite tricarboxylate transporter substrate binding protein [Betaproteobacteria bacterium]|nr:tripartite tricarboxylate transporter substrate binding protein [Betaproteobacteria bacterium]
MAQMSRPILVLSLLLLAISPINLFAQSYPLRPVRLVVPFAPGGPTDILARAIAQKLTEQWGQQIIIDNRPGAAGNIGADLVAKAPADGYTLLMGTVATHGINPGLYKNIPFDAVQDFSPICRVAAVPNVLVVHPSVPVNTVNGLISLARKRSGQLNYSSSGSGTASHLAAELFKTMVKVEIVHIPYKSAAPAVTAVISGQVHVSFASVVPTIPHLRESRLRALGVTTVGRILLLPEVPSISEAGVTGYESVGWTGLLAPAKTAEEIISKINHDIVAILNGQEMRKMLENSGAVVVASKPGEFGVFIKSEIAKWAKVIEISQTRLD